VGRGPLKNRELLKKLKLYGVVVLSNRGKGSETILLMPESPGSKRGAQYPIKDHGAGTEHAVQVISKILDRFNIGPKDFWA